MTLDEIDRDARLWMLMSGNWMIIPNELTMHPLTWDNQKAYWNPYCLGDQKPRVLGLEVCLDSAFPFGVVLVS